MGTHLILIDPLTKLSLKKDSSLMLAQALKASGKSVFLLFKSDLYFLNQKNPKIRVFDFEHKYVKNSFYCENFALKKNQIHIILNQKVTLHMRLDPPFDMNYLQTLWILQGLKTTCKINVINDSQGILAFNEKLIAYTEAKNKIPSYFGNEPKSFLLFIDNLKTSNYSHLILKPINLFQGEGVLKTKNSKKEALKNFNEMIQKYPGGIVAQPFIKEVSQGELRSIYFDGQELGTILKVPPKGAFLANIAQGASFESCKLPNVVKKECNQISKKLLANGVRWLAFDILGNKVSEVNITCPGLLVEVSIANKKNLAEEIADCLY